MVPWFFEHRDLFPACVRFRLTAHLFALHSMGLPAHMWLVRLPLTAQVLSQMLPRSCHSATVLHKSAFLMLSRPPACTLTTTQVLKGLDLTLSPHRLCNTAQVVLWAVQIIPPIQSALSLPNRTRQSSERQQ